MKEQGKWEMVGYTPSAYGRFANLLYIPQARVHRAQQLCFLRPPHHPFPFLLPHVWGPLLPPRQPSAVTSFQAALAPQALAHVSAEPQAFVPHPLCGWWIKL